MTPPVSPQRPEFNIAFETGFPPAPAPKIDVEMDNVLPTTPPNDKINFGC